MFVSQFVDQRFDQIQEQLVNMHQHLAVDTLILAMEDRAEDAAKRNVFHRHASSAARGTHIALSSSARLLQTSSPGAKSFLGEVERPTTR